MRDSPGPWRHAALSSGGPVLSRGPVLSGGPVLTRGPVLHTVIMDQQLEPFKENLCSLYFLTSVLKGSSTSDSGGSQDFRIWITAS